MYVVFIVVVLFHLLVVGVHCFRCLLFQVLVDVIVCCLFLPRFWLLIFKFLVSI